METRAAIDHRICSSGTRDVRCEQLQLATGSI